jgi:hypothetical protein
LRKLTVDSFMITRVVYVSRQVRLYLHYVGKGMDWLYLTRADSGELYWHWEWAGEGGLETVGFPKIGKVGGSKRRAMFCGCLTGKDTQNTVNSVSVQTVCV